MLAAMNAPSVLSSRPPSISRFLLFGRFHLEDAAKWNGGFRLGRHWKQPVGMISRDAFAGMCSLRLVGMDDGFWGSERERDGSRLNIAPEGSTAHRDRHKRILVGQSL